MLDQSKIATARSQLVKSQKVNNADIYESLKSAVNAAIGTIKFSDNKEFQSTAFKHQLKMNAKEFADFVASCITQGVFVERIKIEETSDDMYFDSRSYFVDAIRVTLI